MCVYMYLHPSWVCVSVKSGSNRNAMLSTLTNMERYIISLQNTSAFVYTSNYVCVCTYTTFIWSKKYLDHDLDRNLDYELDHDPEDVSIYTGYSLFNTKRITLLFIVQSLLPRNPPKSGLKLS